MASEVETASEAEMTSAEEEGGNGQEGNGFGGLGKQPGRETTSEVARHWWRQPGKYPAE